MEVNKIYEKVQSFKDKAYRAGAGVLAAATLMTGVASAGNYDVERRVNYGDFAEDVHLYFEKIDEWTNKLEDRLNNTTNLDEVLAIHEKYINLERLYNSAERMQQILEYNHRDFCKRNYYCSINKGFKRKVKREMEKLRKKILYREKKILTYNIELELNKLKKELNKALNNQGHHKNTTEKE